MMTQDDDLHTQPDDDGTYCIVQNIDHCDEEGNYGMSSRVIASGFATYDDAWQAMNRASGQPAT